MSNLTNNHGIELIKIEPGSFLMGSDFDVVAGILQKLMLVDLSWENEVSVEWPQHPVEISQQFYISRYPVTNKIFRNVIPNNTTTEVENKPALLTWNQVELFLRELNSQDNQFHFRLPTEAEWEYCCKAGTGYEFLNSDDHDDNERFMVTGEDYQELEDFCKTVGSSGKNDWGICDMLGNVPEWCSDYFDPDYYLDSPTTNPENTAISALRVMRGAPGFDFIDNYSVPYRSSARHPITCSNENREGEDFEYDDEEYYCNRAGLRLIATKE